MRSLTAVFLIGLAATITTGQDSSTAQDSAGSQNQGSVCNAMVAEPVAAVAGPLQPSGAGILLVVEGIVDPVTAAASAGPAARMRRRQDTSASNSSSPDADDDGGPAIACTPHEVCYLTDGGNPFCFDSSLGTFHDLLNTTGNAITGTYKLADGKVGNYFDGPHPGIVGGNSTGGPTGAGTRVGRGGVAAAVAVLAGLCWGLVV